MAAMTLFNGLQHAKNQYTIKRDHFAGLTIEYGERTEIWSGMSRAPTRTNEKDRKVESVYRGKTHKGLFIFSLHITNT